MIAVGGQVGIGQTGSPDGAIALQPVNSRLLDPKPMARERDGDVAPNALMGEAMQGRMLSRSTREPGVAMETTTGLSPPAETDVVNASREPLRPQPQPQSKVSTRRVSWTPCLARLWTGRPAVTMRRVRAVGAAAVVAEVAVIVARPPMAQGERKSLPLQ